MITNFFSVFDEHHFVYFQILKASMRRHTCFIPERSDVITIVPIKQGLAHFGDPSSNHNPGKNIYYVSKANI